jgi:hypothetical protein
MFDLGLLLVLQSCYQVLVLGCAVRQALLNIPAQTIDAGRKQPWNSNKDVVINCVHGMCTNGKNYNYCDPSKASCTVACVTVYFFTSIVSDGTATCEFTYESGTYSATTEINKYCA